MSETSDNEKQSGGISPNVKIIAALIIGLLLGAWANDEFDKPKRKYTMVETDIGIAVLDEETGDVWFGSTNYRVEGWYKKLRR